MHIMVKHEMVKATTLCNRTQIIISKKSIESTDILSPIHIFNVSSAEIKLKK